MSILAAYWTVDTMQYAMALAFGMLWFVLQIPFIARNLAGLLADRRVEDDAALVDAFEDYGLYWPVSPPSHAAGRTA